MEKQNAGPARILYACQKPTEAGDAPVYTGATPKAAYTQYLRDPSVEREPWMRRFLLPEEFDWFVMQELHGFDPKLMWESEIPTQQPET